MEIGALSPQIPAQPNSTARSDNESRTVQENNAQRQASERQAQPTDNVDSTLQEDTVSISSSTSAPSSAAQTAAEEPQLNSSRENQGDESNANPIQSTTNETVSADRSLSVPNNTSLSTETSPSRLSRDDQSPAQELETRINDILGEPSEIERQVDELV